MNKYFEYPLSPVSLQNCRVTGGFWNEKMEINRKITLPVMFHRYKKSPYPHSKWLEATAYHLAVSPDCTAERRFESAVSTIKRLQAKDGFIGNQKPG